MNSTTKLISIIVWFLDVLQLNLNKTSSTIKSPVAYTIAFYLVFKKCIFGLFSDDDELPSVMSAPKAITAHKNKQQN